MKFKKRIWTMFLICAVILVTGQTVFAGSYQEDRKGSITLKLEVAEGEKTVPVSGISLSLYQVGTADTEHGIRFILDKKLADTEVDINALDTAQKAQDAAEKLAEVVKDAGVSVVSAKTDDKGKAVYRNLDKGMYLVLQKDGQDRCEVAPMLLSVPGSIDGKDWKFDISANLKAEKKDYPGALKVEKRVLFREDGEWVEKKIKERSYYVGLFLDKEATIPFGEAKKITIRNDSRGAVSFTELPIGTYYLRETDAKGNPYPVNEKFKEEDGNVVSCVIMVEGQQTTRIDFADNEGESKNAVVENYNPDSNISLVKTSDNQMPAVWSVMTGLALIIIIAAIVWKKRNKVKE